MKSLIYIAEGFEECEALIVVDLLRRAGLEIDMVSISEDKAVKSSHGVTVVCDQVMKDIDARAYDT
ncbi:DJ-1/PfpI family protein, partial [Acinetobacter baumannii]|nr:DJ-1/PfpI family protein [Acinetobacter baumannii]